MQLSFWPVESAERPQARTKVVVNAQRRRCPMDGGRVVLCRWWRACSVQSCGLTTPAAYVAKSQVKDTSPAQQGRLCAPRGVRQLRKETCLEPSARGGRWAEGAVEWKFRSALLEATVTEVASDLEADTGVLEEVAVVGPEEDVEGLSSS